jgi:high-affinity Fe2+/Pb2+ permease
VFGSTLGVALTNAAVWVGAVALVAVAGLAGYAVYRYGLVRLDLVEVAS